MERETGEREGFYRGLVAGRPGPGSRDRHVISAHSPAALAAPTAVTRPPAANSSGKIGAQSRGARHLKPARAPRPPAPLGRSDRKGCVALDDFYPMFPESESLKTLAEYSRNTFSVVIKGLVFPVECVGCALLFYYEIYLCNPPETIF